MLLPASNLGDDSREGYGLSLNWQSTLSLVDTKCVDELLRR